MSELVENAVSITMLNKMVFTVDMEVDPDRTASDIAGEYADQIRKASVAIRDADGKMIVIPAYTIERIEVDLRAGGPIVELRPDRMPYNGPNDTEPNADGDYEDEQETEPDHGNYQDATSVA